nr:transposase [uncultured Flavobacterium sp.]
MSKFKHFLGIDVSKEYFDVVLIMNGEKEKPIHNQFVNDSKGVKALNQWLKKQKATNLETLVCLEHTGMYGKLIIKYLMFFNYSLWVEKSTLMRNSKEIKSLDPELSKLFEKFQKKTLKGITSDLKEIEKQLDVFIKGDENLNKIYSLAISVPGVGKVTTLYLICFTNEFKAYSSPRQLACYAGVVPFEYTSGKSIRSKPRVHHMANKKLKKHLHMCALSAVNHDPEMKEYFKRKVAEGKNKMLVINNIRNKLVHRICACIRENKKFEVRKAA